MENIPFRKLTKNDLYGSILIIILTALLIWLTLGNMIFSLNKVSFAKGGDGAKGYYSSQYHVQHDEGITHFNGMNYPFGEHIFFTDCQPHITIAIKLTKDTVFDISDKTIGIINSLMLVSLIFGALFLYLIFRKCRIPHLPAILFSLIIIFLSPQIQRMSGHFSLAYLSHIPGTIWFLILFYEKKNLKTSLWLFIWGIFIALTHFYFFGIYAMLLLLFWLYAFFNKRFLMLAIWKKIGFVLLQIGLPLLLIWLFLLTDNVVDRPGTPWGFLHYRAFPESVFLPFHKPYGQWVTQIFNTGYIDWEGLNYMGVITTLFTLFVIIKVIVRLMKRQWTKVFNICNHPLLNLFLWASFLSLLYSFGLPYILNMEGILRYLGPIKQMRGIARFSWLFYYIMFILAVITVDRITKKSKTIIRYSIFALLTIIGSIEAYFNINGHREAINNSFPSITIHETVMQNNDKYQAIVLLPYVHIGSENIWLSDGEELFSPAFVYSLKTGIPITSVLMSRTSLSQTWQQITPFYYHTGAAEILKKYNEKSLLIIARNDTVTLKPVYKHIIRSATKLETNETWSLYSISFDNYKAAISTNKKSLSEVRNHLLNEAIWQKNGKDTIIDKFNRNAYIFDTIIPDTINELDILFAIEDITIDLYPRIPLHVLSYSEEYKGNSYYQNLGAMIYAIEGKKALIRMHYRMDEQANRLHLALLPTKEMKPDQRLVIEKPVVFKASDDVIQ